MFCYSLKCILGKLSPTMYSLKQRLTSAVSLTDQRV